MKINILPSNIEEFKNQNLMKIHIDFKEEQGVLAALAAVKEFLVKNGYKEVKDFKINYLGATKHLSCRKTSTGNFTFKIRE